MQKRTIDINTLEELALGCAILGSGGGGDIAFDLPPAREAIKRYGPVPLISVDSLDRDALIVPIGFMGAPLEPGDTTAGQKELERLLHEVEKHYGQKVDALIPLEIGGGNGLTPLAHAGRLGIAVLDADTIGRAFPMLHMTSCALANIMPSPAFIADSSGNVLLLKTQSAEATERLARVITAACGSVSALATYIVRGCQAKEALILESYSKALLVGRSFRENRASMRAIGAGSIIEHTPRLDGGFLIGKTRLDSGHVISFQNEYFFVTKGDRVLAETPNIIVIWDIEEDKPLSIEGVKVGKNVEIYTMDAPPLWLTPQGMQVAGPDAFRHLCVDT